MKKLLLALGLLSLLPQFPGAEEFSLDRMGASAFTGAGQAVPVPLAAPAEDRSVPAAAAQAVLKEWTVMVFLNAKNDLERFGMQDMNEMEKVGSTDRVNVVVEMGRMAGHDSSDGDWRGVRRYYVTRDFNPFRINSRLVEDLGSVNMGDANELRKFILWAKQNFPARRYALVVWNHGNGWLRGNPAPYDSSKGISFDDETGNNIDTPQLRMALGDAGGVDVLASDACLMQMAEVAYEVRDVARYMVGSEETEPGAGYNYTKVLLPLALVPDMGAEAFGRVIVAAYWDNNKFGRVATHSLLDLSRAGELAGKMDAFARAAMASPRDKHLLWRARNGAQRYAIDENKDLGHFLALLERSDLESGELRAAARDLNGFLENGLVKLNMTSILPRSNSNGLAVYIPGVAFNSDYPSLALARDTQWDEFLRWQGR